MNITPRKSEAEALLSVLTEVSPVVLLGLDGHDPAERLALGKALVKAAWAALLERDLWFVVNRWPAEAAKPFNVTYGPFTSEAEVLKFAKRAELIGQNYAVPMFSPGVRQREIAQRSAEERRVASGIPLLCEQCGHPDYVHQHQGLGDRCGLLLAGCLCPQYVPPRTAGPAGSTHDAQEATP